MAHTIWLSNMGHIINFFFTCHIKSDSLHTGIYLYWIEDRFDCSFGTWFVTQKTFLSILRLYDMQYRDHCDCQFLHIHTVDSFTRIITYEVKFEDLFLRRVHILWPTMDRTRWTIVYGPYNIYHIIWFAREFKMTRWKIKNPRVTILNCWV